MENPFLAPAAVESGERGIGYGDAQTVAPSSIHFTMRSVEVDAMAIFYSCRNSAP